MVASLRPLTLGEILDRTAQLYRSNFFLFAGIFAVYAGVALVLSLLLIGLGELLKVLHVGGAAVWITLIASGIEMLILFLLFGAAVAAINRAVAWVHLGEPATIRGAYASILPELGRYLWLMTITAFVVWTPLALLYGAYFGTMAFSVKGFGTPAGIAAAQQAGTSPQSAVLLFGATLVFGLLLLPVGIYTVMMGLRYALALPACVVENLKARQALRRAAELSKGARGRILVLGLLVGVIKIGLIMVTQVFVLVAAFKQHGQLGPGLTALSQVLAFFTNSFLGPIYAAGITLFYFDQRVRKEGFDIEWMMRAAGLAPPAGASEAQQVATGEIQ
jgi:UPF0716 family protein affecting phage T7 exclusion